MHAHAYIYIQDINICCKNRLVVLTTEWLATLVAQLFLVSETDCIKSQGGSFLVVSFSFPYSVRMKTTGGNSNETGCVIPLA